MSILKQVSIEKSILIVYCTGESGESIRVLSCWGTDPSYVTNLFYNKNIFTATSTFVSEKKNWVCFAELYTFAFIA